MVDSSEFPSRLLQAVEEINYTSECFIPYTHSNKRKVVVLSDRFEDRALGCRCTLKPKQRRIELSLMKRQVKTEN